MAELGHDDGPFKVRISRLTFTGLPRQFLHLTAVRGAAAGSYFWFLCTAVFFVLDAIPNRLSEPLHGAVSQIHMICAMVSHPVSVAGWLFVWGDNGPQDPLLESHSFNLWTGLLLNAALGAALFQSRGSGGSKFIFREERPPAVQFGQAKNEL